MNNRLAMIESRIQNTQTARTSNTASILTAETEMLITDHFAILSEFAILRQLPCGPLLVYPLA